MEEQRMTLKKFKFLGGWLCLDFANTADWHASDHPVEKLNEYADLVKWSVEAGFLSESHAFRLLQKAAAFPGEAAEVLSRAIKLREAIYLIFSSVAAGSPPGCEVLDALNGALAEKSGTTGVVPTADGFAWDWIGEIDALDRPLWPVSRSAADLLVSDSLSRVGRCADDRGCGWLFLDTSRNRSRRWCDMKDCGNRAKAREHHRRANEG
jgi:predicted RNA-binding Zn ribbon-like protein